MKLKNLSLLIIVSGYSHFVAATIGNKIDTLVNKSYAIYERASLEVRFKTGLVPALTLENIKQYPEHKQDYIAYAIAHIDTLDPLLVAALLREYPTEFAKQKLASILKK